MKLRRCFISLAGGAVVMLAMASPTLASTTAPSVARQAPPPVTITPATANSPRVGPATMTVDIADIDNDCFTPGIIYSVDTTGIHIRALPDGAIVAAIAEGRYFDSEVYIDGEGPYHCVTSATVAGQYWVLGFANYDTDLVGYVGLDYLRIVTYT
jgi:hypothetical protein